MEQMTNDEFARTNAKFIEACKRANIPPTRRQAGRWRNRQGKAYLFRDGRSIDNEDSFEINAIAR